MAKIRPLFKFIAVVNSVLLFGAYVCYRGGVVKAFESKSIPSAAPDSHPTSTASPSPPPDNQSVIMPGSKVGMVDFERSRPPASAPTQPTVSEPEYERIIMSGSKSAGVEFTPHPSRTQKQEASRWGSRR